MKNDHKVYWIINNSYLFENHPEYIRSSKIVVGENFDEKRLCFDRGPIGSDWPGSVQVLVNGTEPVDLLLCSPYIEIVSDRVRIIIQELSPEEVEFLPVNVFQTNGQAYKAMKYWAINILTILDVLSWDDTVWVGPTPPQKDDPMAVLAIIKPRFFDIGIRDHHIFRYEVNGKIRPGWYISIELMRRLRKQKCTIGFEFGPILTV